MAEFGEQLRKARQNKEITQQTLANKLFVTRQTVSRWESGNRYPDILTIKKIAEVLDISIDELIRDEKPSTIVERSNIIEKPLVNNLSIILYAGIVVSYSISIIETFIKLPSIINISISDIWIIVPQLLSQIIGIIIFILGLIYVFKGTLTPSKSGLIVCIFFFINFMNDISKLHLIKTNFLLLILLSITSILGIMISYLFYFKEQSNKYYRSYLYLISILNIVRSTYTFITTIIYANNYFSTKTVLSLVLSICIYILIIYQIYTLNKKRCLASNT